MDPRAYRIAREFVRAQVRQALEQTEEFWSWMRQNHPRVRNPNPDGRERDIASDTLKDYAEGGGNYAQQATQIVEQYYRQYQQTQEQEGGAPQKPPTEKERRETNRQNLEIAKNGKVVDRKVLSSGGRGTGGPVNQSEIVKMEHEGKTQNFIRKPAEGEERNLRIGIPGGQYHAREAASYGFDSMLGGRGVVPVTHTRGDEDGSYQVWAQGARAMHGDDLDELVEKVSLDDLPKNPDFQRLNLVDLITGHEDRHRGNLLYHFEGEEKPENLRFVAIDNGLSMAAPSGARDHRVYVNPFTGWYREDKEAVQAAMDRGDFNEAMNIPRKEANEAEKKGNAAVAKSLSRISSDLLGALEDLDLDDVAKTMTSSGINDKGAVRAMLVRIASLRSDPNIFRDLLQEEGGDLGNAWRTFQHLSGKDDELLFRSGAGEDAEREIDRALARSTPKGGWGKPFNLEEASKAMQDMDGWGATDQSTRRSEPPVQSEIDWSKMASKVRDRWLLAKSKNRSGRGRKLTVSLIDRRTLKPKVVGVFELTRDKKVKESYKDYRFMAEVKRGLRVMGKKIKPEDGPRFMAAIEKVYGGRSMYDVKRT